MSILEETKDFACCASSPKMGTDTKKYPMRIEGHRGAGHLAAENSLKAFKKAIELGIDGVELDVWLTKDNVPVVVHGDEVGKVEFEGGLEKVVGEVEFETLIKYVMKNGETIPSLAEVLDVCKDRVHVNIELKEKKEEVIGKTLALLEERDMFKEITFSSFDHAVREKISKHVNQRRIAEKVSFGFLMELEEIKFPDYQIAQPGDSINVDIRYLIEHKEECIAQIKKAQANEVKVKFWFPMDHADEHMFYEDLLDLEVDTIITNKPASMIEYFVKSQEVYI